MTSDFIKMKNDEIYQMTANERSEYFNRYKDYVLSLPFDEEAMNTGERKYLHTANFIGSKFKRLLAPNVVGKHYDTLPHPFILVTNHLGSFDQFLHGAAFPNVVFHYMIAKSLLTYKNFCVGKFYIKRGAFAIDTKDPEDRKRAEEKALQYAFRGKNLMIFPEGTRTVKYGSDGTVQKFHKGAVSIAQAAQIPIIPAAINNNFKKGKLFINIGNVFEVSYEDDVSTKTDELRERVIELWEENNKHGAVILVKNNK